MSKSEPAARRHYHPPLTINGSAAALPKAVGIAMGAADTDVATRNRRCGADGGRLEKLVYAFQLARKNERLVRQNLALSVIVISVLIVGAVLGAFSLLIAVLGHEISEFVVIGNGLRMLKT